MTTATIVQAIKEEIIFGKLRPRERLVEEEICSRMGVSRHSLRSAIISLESMGLIVRRQNKGAIVRDFSLNELNEIYQARSLIQIEAIKNIKLPVESVVLNKLKKIHQDFIESSDAGDLGKVCALNNDFHFAIFNECKNSYLLLLLERIWTETLGVRCYSIGDTKCRDQTILDHEDILNALEQGDREKLQEIVESSIWLSLEHYSSINQLRTLSA